LQFNQYDIDTKSDLDTSDESKENSKRQLEELGGEQAFYGKQENAQGSK
jgi:hypothetical protein